MRCRFPALILLAGLLPLLGGCVAAVVGGAAVGASAAHDRRDTGSYVGDKRLHLAAYNELNKDKELALQNNVLVVVHNGILLLVGEVRNEALKARAEQHVSGFQGTRKVINELSVQPPEGFWSRRRDNTITAHVKTALLDVTSMKGFDPSRINVTTAHRTVYLMGLVRAEEAEAAVAIARDVNGVEKVVKVFEYVPEDG